jgi:hypothetical protein
MIACAACPNTDTIQPCMINAARSRSAPGTAFSARVTLSVAIQ